MDAYDRYCFAAGMGASSQDADAYAHRGTRFSRASYDDDDCEPIKLGDQSERQACSCEQDGANAAPTGGKILGGKAPVEGGDTQRTDV